MELESLQLPRWFLILQTQQDIPLHLFEYLVLSATS